jgi:sulfatase modifying factor 1
MMRSLIDCRRGAEFSLLIATLFCVSTNSASADGFGSGANAFEIRFVTIGELNNAPDTTGTPNPVGSVSYAYRMAMFEVSEDMINKANALGILRITQDSRNVDKPATSVSWNEAARFVNWLNTSSGGVPAYKFATQPGQVGYNPNDNIQLWAPGDAGYNPSNLYRNSFATYFLPTVDEWYKTVYFDPTGGSYFDYPHLSNSPPTPAPQTSAPNTDVYGQDISAGPAFITAAGGPDAYGTTAQGGNVAEWLETDFDLVNDSISSARGVRGGYWYSTAADLLSTAWTSATPGTESNIIGFRVAAVPEPGALVLFTLGSVIMCWPRNRALC